MISQSLPRYDHRQSRQNAQSIPRASLLGVPAEIFNMPVRSLACCDNRSLRHTCNTEIVRRCKDSFYNIVDPTTASLQVSPSCAKHKHILTLFLQLDAEFAARAVSLAKFERWSDHIITLRLKVPSTAFFYQLQQGNVWTGEGDVFSSMANTKEFKSALGLLTALPRCKAILIQHDTPSRGWLMYDFQSSRRKIRNKTIAVLDDVLRENLEVSFVCHYAYHDGIAANFSL